jgi:microcystin-dependent protein
MSEPFVGQIQIFGFNFAPQGWALCAGQILPISQNTALFSILGTTYGGDGKSNFALPNLQGRVPIQQGQGSGLTLRSLGEIGGEEFVTLSANQMPGHTHAANCNNAVGTAYDPAGQVWSQDAGGNQEYGTGAVVGKHMSSNAVLQAGGGQPHNNLQPYLVLNYCIAMQGVFPPRS